LSDPHPAPVTFTTFAGMKPCLPAFARVGLTPRRHAITTLTAAVFFLLFGCAREQDAPHNQAPASTSRDTSTSGITMKTPEQVQSEYESGWMKHPHVIGVGVGEQGGKPALVIFASAPHDSHADIPTMVEGYAVRIEVVGDVKAGE
jgi:hypothetical protein